jgi:23S rRNA (adenine2503-C2)-methyltransferase
MYLVLFRTAMNAPPVEPRTNLFGLSLPELEAVLTAQGLERYRAAQIFHWLYNRGVTDIAACANLSKDLRTRLAAHFEIRRPTLAREQRSADGTRKFLFALDDGRRIETVLIPSEMVGDDAEDETGAPKRLTLCVSTQVGCPLDCAFCATATMKLKRDLTVGEIAGQYLAVQALSPHRITNLVYMGMGEPMLNYDAVMASVDLISHEKTGGVGASRITISTAGLVDGIRRLADENRRVKLAVSLHATTDELRRRLMPIARRHDLAALTAAVEDYYLRVRRPVTWEYILFDGLNDAPEDAGRLARLARRIPGKVNLIPFHPIDGASGVTPAIALRATPQWRIEEFAALLRSLRVTVMLRSSAGKDIDAACGQLAVRQEAARRGGGSH